MSRCKAVIFDRDGVLNVDHGYVFKPENFEWVEGAKESIKALNDAGVLVVVATNQSGIARGMFSEADFHELMDWVQLDLKLIGAKIDRVFFCPHHPTEGEPPYQQDCDCRKPKPGMILAALNEFGLAPDEVVLIGDSERDVAAATAAGVKGAIYSAGSLLALIRDLGILADH